MEAVRIIKEMREATDGRNPRFIVWENVPGAFSSNGGEDFRTVLEEIARIKGEGVAVPQPKSGRWKHAGEVLGDGYSIAWRVLDAQYWGVPQRRKRIFLVADFGSERAGKIQFESDRLYWDSAEGGGQGQGTAGASADHAGTPSRGIGADIYNGELTGNIAATLTTATGQGAANTGPSVICLNDQGGSQMDVSVGITGTLRAESHGNNPVVTVYGLSGKTSYAWQSNNPHSGCYKAETTRTLDTGGGDPTRNQGGMIVVYENHGQDNRYKELGKIGETVTAKYGTGGNNTPIVVEPKPYSIGNGQAHSLYLNEKARTLDTMHDPQAIIAPALGIDRAAFNQGRNALYGFSIEEEVESTLVAKGPNAVAQPTPDEEYPYIARRLTPLECCRLQGFPDYWCDGLETENPTEEDVGFWECVFETHRKALNPSAKPKTRKQIEKWLKNPRSDSAQYKMWGNSLAVPCAYHVLKGIAEASNQSENQERKERLKTAAQMTIWDFFRKEKEMEVGNINDRHTWITHPITEEILQLAKEHPDYPITVLCGESANSGDYYWMYATSVSVGIDEILDCNSEWWDSEYVCTDREDFEDAACRKIWDKLNKELGREPSDIEMEEAWKAVKEAHEPYWKKCIAIKADN